MLLACYILTLFATTLLLAGQFVWLAPMLACFTAPLWWQLLRDRRTYSMPLFWLWLAFCALILAQLLNAGSHTQEGGEVILSFPRHDWLPFTLHPRIAFQFLAGWLAAGGLIVAGGMPDVGRRKSDALQACLCLAMTVAIMGIIEHHWHLGFYFNVIPWGAPHFAVFPYINNAGTFFMLAMAIALHKGRWAWLLVPLFGYCIWLVDCRAMLGAVGLLVTFAVLQKLKCKVFSIVIILLAGIVFLLFKADELMKDRWQEYVINWRLWLMRPVFGNGVHGNILMAGLGTDWWFADALQVTPNNHNDVLCWLVEYGAVGVGLLAGIVALVARRKVEPMLVAGVLLACAHAMIDMPFRCPAVLAVVACMLIPRPTGQAPVASPAVPA
jgi:hypothetical protein